MVPNLSKATIMGPSLMIALSRAAIFFSYFANRLRSVVLKSLLQSQNMTSASKGGVRAAAHLTNVTVAAAPTVVDTTNTTVPTQAP